MTEIIIIAAIAEHNVIGKNNALPWHIKEDLVHFKKLTLGYPCIMGRKTYDSLLVKPLPGRENIVLSHTKNYKPHDVTVFTDFDNAIAYAHEKKYPKVFIIGGVSLFQIALEKAATLELTAIHGTYSGDTFFPPINFSEWELAYEEDLKSIDTKNHREVSFSFRTYNKHR